MENLKIELGTALGESLSHMVQIGEQPYAHLYSLYNKQGNSLPVVAKTYLCEGVAQQEADKLSILARNGNIRLPTVYAVVVLSRSPYQELLLVEHLPGVSLEHPTRCPTRWPVLMDQIIENMLAWHRVYSKGCVGMVDACQQGIWSDWYQQRVSILWKSLANTNADKLDHQDKRVLFRSLLCMNKLFEGFDDNAVLVHGNITLRSMLKDPDSDQLLSMINPGMMLWAPREYDLFRLTDEGPASQLLYRYLERAPVDEAFVARRWLYVLWEAVSRYLRTGQLNSARFKLASQHLLPWLE